ncbi:PQQ-dependent sugar dehydrogenase [Pontibacter sp. E15-1]|uniref:PQQ-dependent sugar dehydrogenase n=1 Tax=Pontibacter sp. E15-1 TaxID=2919918 RepID=UPI001F4FD584|nr:PQQ-dependent sugar dehydrogenase [Pontibacter sp. E15-1]MCJ8166736.1 PQQ-dependent sugar dehydrogenase [Pontibacter sp. E15-1]
MKNLYKVGRRKSPLLKFLHPFSITLRPLHMVMPCLVLLALLFTQVAWAQPTGFAEEEVGDDWEAAVGLTFSTDGKRMYVWEKAGKVWIVENGEKVQTPLIDISEEVGNWGDHGLLGFSLDPNFDTNGYIYLLYVVDRHHLMNFGKGTYRPSANEYNAATIGRVTRYTAKASDERHTVDMNSRKVLLGETPETGIPILYVSHGVGSLVFGADGSLLISAGDGATAGWLDTGYNPADPNDTFVPQALADGIITPKNDIGAFRSQQLESLNGKILRIDPATGKGMPNNPFYSSANPDAAKSKVWALGVRNPFRFTLRPGTGNASNPGVLYLGDVGWQDWEELNVVKGGGMNFGWPIYEGLEKQRYYFHKQVPNTTTRNPLFGEGNCTQEYFYYGDLLRQPVATGDPYFYNPCRFEVAIPEGINTFEHARPAIDWVNSVADQDDNGNVVIPEAITRTGIFTGNDADVISIGAAGSPVAGTPFYGSSATGGIWYTGTALPAEYQNTYFFGDYGAGTIRNATFDANNNPKAIRNFIDEGAAVVAFGMNPVSGELYYINYATQIKKIIYYGENIPPKAVAEADKLYGSSPLTVQFTGNKSTDSEGHALTYKWNFGDGSAVSTAVNPQHTFTGTEIGKIFHVTLTVTDEKGATASAKLKITLNNTPPVVNITSPARGTKYPLTDRTEYILKAAVADAEHSANQLTYEWQTVMHHNTHQHPEPIDNNPETTTLLTPIGCDGETYFYRIHLKVTDAGGLSATDYVDIYPDCSAGTVAAVAIASPSDNSVHAVGQPIPFQLSFGEATREWASVQYFRGTTLLDEVFEAPFSFTWAGAPAGSYSITVKATDVAGHTVVSAPISISVGEASQPSLQSCLPGLQHYFGMDNEAGSPQQDFASATAAVCATCPESAEGKFAKAVRFNGQATKLDIEDGTKFNWGKDANFTISLWMRSEAALPNNAVIVGRDAKDSEVHWWVGMNTKGQPMFMLKDLDHVGIYIGEKGQPINDGAWHQVVSVRDGSNKKSKLYIDGVLMDEAEYFYEKGFESADAINIGYMNRDNGYHYNGDLDELKLYNRALTQEEIVSSFNGGSGVYCGSTALGMTDNNTFAGTYEVFPNPTSGEQLRVYVSSLEPNEQVQLVLTDLTGKTVLTQKAAARPDGTLQTTIAPKKAISAGIYNLLMLSDARKLNRKVVILE